MSKSGITLVTFWLIFALTNANFLPPDFEEVQTTLPPDVGGAEKCEEGARFGLWECVSYDKCDPETNTTITENTDGEPPDYSQLIDIRLGSSNKLCKESLAVCCKKADSSGPTPKPTPEPTPEPDEDKPTPKPTPKPKPKPPKENKCGKRNKDGLHFHLSDNTNEAQFAEFPWMVAILNANYNPFVDNVLAICGGSLIGPKVVLTGAHCVHKLRPSDIKIRAGEWDTQTTKEPYPFQERNVKKIIIHEEFKDNLLFNDVALLILEKPLSKARHIGTVCLPDQNEEIISKDCYATGWGKNLFGRKGEYQVILKKIDLPIVSHNRCQSALQATKLGHKFRLHFSFTCAGGIPGKDTCTGDGGSPLVCPDPKNPSRYIQAGIVAWGIGCGTATPGVYANVAKFRGWVDLQMENLQLSTLPYTS